MGHNGFVVFELGKHAVLNETRNGFVYNRTTDFV